MKKRKLKYHIQPKLQDQAVWMSATAVFLLFFIGFISFSDHSSLTGAAVQNIAFMAAGSQFNAGVREIPGLEQYSIELTGTVKNGQIVVKENPAIQFNQPFYAKFTISSNDPEKMGTTQLFLKLEEQSLHSKGISQGDLRIFHNGEEVETTFTRQEERYFYYTATASSIGDFVIGKAAPVEVISDLPEERGEEPAAEILPIEIVAPAEPKPEADPLAPLVGEAIQQPASTGFWARIKAFFSELFG